MEQSQTPKWYENGRVDEVEFSNSFILKHHMVYKDGSFFGIDGRIPGDETLRRMIYEELYPYLRTGVARKVESILANLRLEGSLFKMDDDVFEIHTLNGVYYPWELRFSALKLPCYRRLSVNYNDDAPEPKVWLKFLEELLEPTDIDTLQEFMGYCLLPTTKAQKMLIITGKGGEGKSRIGVVMKQLLGSNMNMGSIAKLEQSPFARADLQHRLLMVDDDLRLEALPSTNYIKSIVTAEIPMDLERKGIQSYQGELYCRIMAFGNGTLRSLHDKSHGFFRRQIILNAKPRPEDRVDDPYLSERLAQERDGIFMWCLAGLARLMAMNFHFTISDQASENISQAASDANNVLDFLQSSGYIQYGCGYSTTSQRLYQTYLGFCKDNAYTPFSTKSFTTTLKTEASRLGLRYDRCIDIGNGRYARGFRGVRILL